MRSIQYVSYSLKASAPMQNKKKKNKQKAEKTSNQIKTIPSMYGAVHRKKEHSLLSVNLNSNAKIDASTVLHVSFTFFFCNTKNTNAFTEYFTIFAECKMKKIKTGTRKSAAAKTKCRQISGKIKVTNSLSQPWIFSWFFLLLYIQTSLLRYLF